MYSLDKKLPSERLKDFQQIIAYEFKDISYLKQALTHSSFSKECQQQAAGNGPKAKESVPADYERLEFLGDAVLELVTSRMLFEQYDWEEGKLTKVRANIVCEPSLALIARTYGLGEYMVFGHGEEKTGGRKRDSILCDLVEAVIGAVYLDGGFEEAKALIERMVFVHLKDIMNQGIVDYKSFLQEYLQSKGRHTPDYQVAAEQGPPHDRTFVINLCLDGKVFCTASGKSKKKAEQEAARMAIIALKANEQ